MMEKKLLIRICALSSVVVCLMTATSSAQLVLAIDSVSVSAFPVVRAKVHVTENNATVTGLNVSNFTVFEDGVVQAPIQAFCNDTLKSSPVSVMLVIDKSGSMAGSPLMAVKTAAKNFVDRLSAGDEAALVSFATGSPSYDQSWTNNKTTLKNAIDQIREGGSTYLWRAVRTASQLTRTRVNKKVMIVLTDGDDNEPIPFNTTLSQAIAQANSDGVTVFSIGLGAGIVEADLRQLAQQTGGKYYAAPSSGDLDAIYQQIARQITTSGVCEIWYTSKINCLNGSTHTLDIAVSARGQSDRRQTTFKVPLDSTSFSFVDMAMGRLYVVEQDSLIRVPIALTRVTINRPPKVFQFALQYNKSFLELMAIDTTALTGGYTVQTTATSGGTDVTLLGARPILATGNLVQLTFRALPSFESRKAEIGISRPDVQQFCTVTSASSGLITISGRCERALGPNSRVQQIPSRILGVSPNPFNPTTTIHYRVGRSGMTTLRLYDELGREMQHILRREMKEGEYDVVIDGAHLSSGRYYLKLEAENGADVRQVIVLK